MDYTMVMSGPSGDNGPTEPGYINGGMTSRSSIPATGPVVTMGVDDIDATLTKVEENGGSRLGEKTAGRRHGLRRLLPGLRGQRPRPLGEPHDIVGLPADTAANCRPRPGLSPTGHSSGTLGPRSSRPAPR